MSAPNPGRRGRHRTEPPPLSAREVRFCRLWVETGNATRAYIDAGFTPPTPNAATVGARKLLRKSHVRECIRHLQRVAADAARVTVEDVAAGFRSAVDCDLTRLMGPDGEMLPPSQWPADVRRHVTKIEVEELTEMVPDPANPRRKKKVAVGSRWKVWVENKTDCRKVLAQWLQMVGGDRDATAGKPPPTPLVVEKGLADVPPPADTPE